MLMNETLENQTHGSALPDSAMQSDMARMLENSSVEMPARAAEYLPAAQALLNPGTRIYIPSLANQSTSTALQAVRETFMHGFEPVPHVAARRVRSRAELGNFIAEAVANYGVRRVMLIAGDVSPPTGLYYDSLAVLEDGVLSESGLGEVALSGYPEGHPVIDHKRLSDLMVRKLEAARAQNLRPAIVTQFCFAPARVVEYCSEITRIDDNIKVHAGVAGPTDPVALFRYARLCGVNASRQALSRLGAGIARLAVQTDPTKQIQGLARYINGRSSCRLAGIHLYSFGGLVRTAEWLRQAKSNSD